MAASKNKTQETEASVLAFIKKVDDKKRREDCLAICELMSQETAFPAKMWGTAIIGFGSYHYVYDSGREGDAPLVGFSPRKNEFALYIANFEGKEKLLESFGKHKTAKACVYIKKLEDIDPKILRKLVSLSAKHTQKKNK
jgi:hypothetical protein